MAEIIYQNCGIEPESIEEVVITQDDLTIELITLEPVEVDFDLH